MLNPGTVVKLNESILEEDDRRRSFFLFRRIIDDNLTGTVDKYQGDKVWVKFPGNGILLEEHNVDRVEVH